MNDCIISRNLADNEKLYNIVTATERGDRGGCHVVFPSLTFQNPEEGKKKPPKRRLWIKRCVDIIFSLFWTLDCLIQIHSIHLPIHLQKLQPYYIVFLYLNKKKLKSFETGFQFRKYFPRLIHSCILIKFNPPFFPFKMQWTKINKDLT